METEKKQGKKKVNRTLVTRILKGNTAYLVLGAVFLLVAVMAAYCGPLVTSFTVDYVIDSKESNLPGWVMGWIEHWGGREFLRGKIWICALALIACTLVNGFATYLRRRYVALASEGVAMTLRNALYSHLQNVPYDYHKHVSTGDLVQRCTSDVDTVRRFISVQLLEIVRTVAMVTVACYIMFSTDVRMALISMVLLPVLCVSSFLYFKRVRSQFTLSDEAEGKLSATLQENLAGVRVVDVNPESLTIEATGAEGKIDALLGLLEHYGIIELVRSGAVAVTRGPKALSEKVLGSEITGR